MKMSIDIVTRGRKELAPLPKGFPAVCYPTGERRGAYNYTIKCPSGRNVVVQVHLKKGGFYVKAGNTTEHSPTVKWSVHGGIKKAWHHVVDMVGGWGST